MDLREHGTAADTLTRHPWERARLAVVFDLLDDYAPARSPIIDLGAGDGFVASAVAARGHDVVAIDTAYDEDDIASLAARGVRARIDSPAEGQTSTLLLLDVIEHVADDTALLATARMLARGGNVIVTVPAWPSLWSSHDEALGHHRRYTKDTLEGAIARAGLVVVEAGSLFSLLVLPRLVSATLRVQGDGAASWRAPRVVSDALTSVLVVDARLCRALSARGVPWPGLSLYAVARAAP